MKTITEDSAVIREVVLTGVKMRREIAKEGLQYLLCIDLDRGDAPTIMIMLDAVGADAELDEVYVEFESCLPLESIPRAAIDSDLILTHIREHASELGRSESTVEKLLENLAAASAKLEVEAAEEGIRFILQIGNFKTEATVERARLKPFFDFS